MARPFRPQGLVPDGWSPWMNDLTVNSWLLCTTFIDKSALLAFSHTPIALSMVLQGQFSSWASNQSLLPSLGQQPRQDLSYQSVVCQTRSVRLHSSSTCLMLAYKLSLICLASILSPNVGLLKCLWCDQSPIRYMISSRCSLSSLSAS